jgi:hypothetical protein
VSILNPPTPTPDLPTQIVALGRQGLARVEIAAALGVGVRELEGMAGADWAVEVALDRAEAAALAWWAAAPREAMAAGARFNGASWRRLVAWLIDEAGPGGARAARVAAASRPRARYILPCNGTSRALPDGTCPQCGKRHRRR